MEFQQAIDKIPIVDQHCHMYQTSIQNIEKGLYMKLLSLEAYNPDFLVPTQILDKYASDSVRTSDTFEKYKVAKVLQDSTISGNTSLLFKQSIRLLSSFLGCNAEFEDVISARNERVRREGVNAFASKLFNDTAIKSLILSDYPYLEYTPSEKEGVVWPVRLRNKLVVPALYFSIIDNNLGYSFSESAEKYLSEIDRLIKEQNFVGMKSMIAYGGSRKGSGLNIGNPDEQIVKKEFQLYKERKGRVSGNEVKNLNDYFHRLALEKAIKLNVPLEFHTGIGDTDIVADACNPMLLSKLLNDEEIRHANIILLHGGYPYSAEAAWMAHFFPNVYLDASIVFFTHVPAAARRIEEMLEMAPYGKMLYSSDGLIIPEMFWIASKIAKQSISLAGSDLVEKGVLSEKDALDFAHSFLHGNAERLYQL